MNSCTGKVVDWILNVSKGEIDYGKKSFLCFMLGVATISSGNSNVQLNLTLPDSDSALYVSGKVSLTSESSLSSISKKLP